MYANDSRLKNEEEEVEKFVMANTQELAKDKWLCPLSGLLIEIIIEKHPVAQFVFI
jgi:Arsenite-resistance protein 2